VKATAPFSPVIEGVDTLAVMAGREHLQDAMILRVAIGIRTRGGVELFPVQSGHAHD
jgi:hypothetical protein